MPASEHLGKRLWAAWGARGASWWIIALRASYKALGCKACPEFELALRRRSPGRGQRVLGVRRTASVSRTWHARRKEVCAGARLGLRRRARSFGARASPHARAGSGRQSFSESRQTMRRQHSEQVVTLRSPGARAVEHDGRELL